MEIFSINSTRRPGCPADSTRAAGWAMSATGAKVTLFMGRTYTSSFFEEAEESSAYDSIYYVLDGWRMTSGHSLRLALLLVLLCSGIAQAQTKTIGKTQIVLLGTGTPLPTQSEVGRAQQLLLAVFLILWTLEPGWSGEPQRLATKG